MSVALIGGGIGRRTPKAQGEIVDKTLMERQLQGANPCPIIIHEVRAWDTGKILFLSDGHSMARKRDSMGRYARDYSRRPMDERIREMMMNDPDMQSRDEWQKYSNRMDG